MAPSVLIVRSVDGCSGPRTWRDDSKLSRISASASSNRPSSLSTKPRLYNAQNRVGMFGAADLAPDRQAFAEEPFGLVVFFLLHQHGTPGC